MNALVPMTNGEVFRASTDAAGLCHDIVVATASKIQGRTFVSVEGWQAIAVAHGCVASAIDVRRVTDEGCEGFAATGVLRRMADGIEIGRAEGFVGDDERTWGKRDVYARRAMAQTRAISRVCRSAFAHVVVMMKAGLSTTPAEEVPHEGPAEAEYTEVKEPPARTKLEGKYTSKTALKEALHRFGMELGKAFTVRALDAIVAEHQEALDQCRRDLPLWWTGNGTDEQKGLRRTIEETREALEGQLGTMIEALFACDTKAKRDKWMVANGDAVELLDGPERRRFDAAYEAHDSHIQQMDRVTA